jgi:heme exporter protein CcmD
MTDASGFWGHGFWAMGGYARYVWPSVILTLAALAWNVWSAQRQFRNAHLRATRALQIRSKEAT